MITPNKIITSFGSGFTKTSDKLYTDTYNIGRLIASKGWTVCSGGYFGTMEAISKGAKSEGGKTIGITVKEWESKPNNFIDEEVKMPNLIERLIELIGIADSYIVFRGGTGTLVELSTALELMNKKIIPEKPMIFYTDFWKNVIETLKIDTNLLKELMERNVKYISSPGEIADILG